MIIRINSIWKNWNEEIAVELANCVLRLKWWCEINKEDNKKRDEVIFQTGKIYAYTVCLQAMGFVKETTILKGKKREKINGKKYFKLFNKGLKLDVGAGIKKDYYLDRYIFEKTKTFFAPDLLKKIMATYDYD